MATKTTNKTKPMTSRHPMWNCHPIRWTADVSLVDTLDEQGRIYVWAGGPIIDGAEKPPRVKANGEIDGRSAGKRVCGNCGQHGHNKRTCKNPAVAKAAEPPKAPSGRVCSKCGKGGHNARTCGKNKKAK